MWWRRLAEVQTEHQNGEERGFKWLWTWNGCWCQTGLVWVFQKLLIYWDFHTQPSLGFMENGQKKRKYPVTAVVWTKMPCWGQRRMGRLVRDDRKATVTQITTRYNQGMQKTIQHIEPWSRWTTAAEDHTGCSSCQIRTGNWRMQFAQAHQNWTIEDWKIVAWSDESRFLLWISDGRVRIWRKEHESMDPSCLVSMVQVGGGGGVMVWGIFSWHTLGPLVPIEHHLKCTAYPSIVADHVHPFMTTVYHLLMATSSRIMHHVTKLKSSQTGFLNMTMSSLYSNGLHSHQISIQ